MVIVCLLSNKTLPKTLGVKDVVYNVFVLSTQFTQEGTSTEEKLLTNGLWAVVCGTVF